MTLQQKKERAIRLKLISVLSLCLFFLLWYLVTDVLKLAPATLFPSPVTALKTGIAKWTTKKPDGATLPTHIFSSLRVSLLGFCFGACIGVPLGGNPWTRRSAPCLTLFGIFRRSPGSRS